MHKTINFIVTKDCQLRCKYCYLVGKNVKEKMSVDIAEKAVDFILSQKSFLENDSVDFEFIGGEPTLEMDLIDHICDYLKVEMFRLDHPWFNMYRVGFTTNGLTYHTDKVQSFIEKNRKHLDITITIDGTSRKHNINRVYPNGSGSYNDVVKNIPKWIEQFPSCSTKVTVSSEDIPFIKESVIHLFELGIPGIHINVVFENVWKDGDDRLFEQQLIDIADYIIDNNRYTQECSFFSEYIGKPIPLSKNNNWCGAGHMLSVDAAGNLYPCTRFAQYSLRSKKALVIGNIKDGINQNLLRPFLALDRTTQSPQKCLECEVASGCAWCQGENYDSAQTDTIYQRSTAICLMHKARVRANNYYWNKLYRKLEVEGGREEYEQNKREVKSEIC